MGEGKRVEQLKVGRWLWMWSEMFSHFQKSYGMSAFQPVDFDGLIGRMAKDSSLLDSYVLWVQCSGMEDTKYY